MVVILITQYELKWKRARVAQSPYEWACAGGVDVGGDVVMPGW